MKLRLYQKDALAFCLANPRSYQMMSMGAGKTAITINWCAEILKEPETKGVLVIAPLRTISTSWPEELEKWGPNLTYTTLHGPKKNERLSDNVDLYLVNFEGIAWLFEAIKKFYKVTGKVPFRALVIDEGSMVKSSTTKRFKTLKKLCNLFPKWRTILSGTPAPNSLLDLWSQYYLLDNGERLSEFITHYKNRFFYPIDRMGWTWRIKSGVDTIIYEQIQDITYRLDAADYISLPDRMDNVIKVVLPKKALAQYKKLETDFFMELEESELEVFNAASLSMKLRQFVQGAVYTEDSIGKGPREYQIFHNAKLKILEELMTEACGQGILCAVQFKFELEIIRKKFPDVKVIAGGTSADDAARYIQEWNRGEIPLLLCHPASLSHGVNLQSGSHLVVWYGLTWSLEAYEQLNARLHRSGQKNKVIVHHLVAKGTIDENVMRALKAKFKSQKQLLDYLKGVH